MPIVRLAKDAGFNPEQIRLMTGAFEDACTLVGLTDPADHRRDLVAKAIIEAAQAGERDPARLRERGVQAVQ
jgi:hypothetical protein